MATQHYRTKTQPVRALQFTRRNVGEFDALAGETELFGYTYDGDSNTLYIHDASNDDGRFRLVLSPGDWLVIAADGSLVRWSEQDFAIAYELDQPTNKAADEPHRVPVHTSPSADAALAGLGDMGTWAKAIGDLSQQVITMTQLWQEEARARAEAERLTEGHRDRADKAFRDAKSYRHRMVGWRIVALAMNSTAEALYNLLDRGRKDTGQLPAQEGMDMWRAKLDNDWSRRPQRAHDDTPQQDD
jgi:hypothetical protein